MACVGLSRLQKNDILGVIKRPAFVGVLLILKNSGLFLSHLGLSFVTDLSFIEK
jgi:hypothetical protein